MPHITHTALIPPIPHLKEFGVGDYHLILAHMLTNPKYMAHYQAQAAAGALITLDNGAAEFDTGLPVPYLLHMAEQVGAKEIVLPDVMRSSKLTIEATRQAAVDLYAKDRWHSVIEKNNMQLMIVPQGTNAREWSFCLSVQLDILIQNFPDIRHITIGIAKWTDDAIRGGRSYLLNHYIRGIWNNYSPVQFDIHLLGLGHSLDRFLESAKDTPYQIRSVDSAKPFSYARHLLYLNQNSDPGMSSRQSDYFTQRLLKNQLELARENVAIFRAYAKGTREVYKPTPVEVL